jgi:hypothetical protein
MRQDLGHQPNNRFLLVRFGHFSDLEVRQNFRPVPTPGPAKPVVVVEVRQVGFQQIIEIVQSGVWNIFGAFGELPG